MDLTFTKPKARRAESLAAREDFQTEDGTPNFVAISGQVGLSVEATRYVLTGELPAEAKKAAPAGRKGAKQGDPLS